jgi:hypothetical protein
MANDSCYYPMISIDGKWIVFISKAMNLNSFILNKIANVYLCNISSGKIDCISRSNNGFGCDQDCFDVAINKDGKVIDFCSHAFNLMSTTINGSANLFRYQVK